MALLDTGLDNELLTLDTGLENSAMAAEEQEAGTYWVITSRAKGGANNPFGGSANANQTSQLVQMTEQQLRQEYEDSGQLQQQFGSFDSYLGYVGESQEWIQTADWMLVTPEYSTGSKEWAFLNGEDLAWRPGEREKIQEKIIQDRLLARQNAFQGWLTTEEGQALMQKYGIQPIIYNNDGDQFKWTGSGYQKTIKVDDHAGFADYLKAVLTSVVAGGVTGALFSAAYSALGPLVGLNQYGTAGRILGMLFSSAGGATAGSVAYEDAMDIFNNPNIIVNLQEEFGGQNGIDNEDGTRRYSDWNLPEGYIYNEARNAVIHVASGEEYPVTAGMYSWYVNLPDTNDKEDGGGNTGSTDGSTSGGAPMSQAEANAAIQEILESGLVGQDFFDAAYEAGVTKDQLVDAMNKGILPRGSILNPSDSVAGGTEGRPNLVLYDGNPNLLDENGVWVGGGTFFDRTDPENPRKYYVWTNKETGESVKIYDDELGTYDGGVKDFEAYLKDELPDITEDELILARRLIELGDPVGQVIQDIIAGRKDLNDNDTETVTLPNGETAEVPTTDNRKVGDPCSIGDKYNGTVITAPSGQLVCKIDFGDSTESVDNDGNPDATPDEVPKDGDPCPLPDGSGEGVIKNGECQPRTGVTSIAILPSLVCESGWADSAGSCIPVDDPRISGVNTPVPGQCPVGYSKNRRGECIPNTKGDMGGESEGDNDNGNTPNDGDSCEVDGKEGTYQDGVCVISTNPVNPGVIDLTGDSEWGDGGNGGGNGNGNGDGDGDGNGNGNGPGLGSVGAKGTSNPTWSPIPPGYKFRRFVKRQGVGANAPMIQQPTFQNPDFSGMRQGLLSSMMNQVKKT